MAEIFILSCAKPSEGGGVYKYYLHDYGALDLIKYLPCDRPMYAVKNGGRIHILLRESFTNGHSGYFSANLHLDDLSDVSDTSGAVACHLAIDGNDNYIVNFLSGNIVKNCQKAIFHEGKGINPLRQEASHTHCVIFTPDKNVAVCDLGLDALFIYDKGLNYISEAKVPNGYGIRHAVFSKDGNYIYSISELVSSINIFTYGNGKVKYLKTQLLECKNKKANGAAIRITDKGYIYCSVREENELFVYKAENENLIFIQKADCGGSSPRDFNIAKYYLITANEKSNNVMCFLLKDGIISEQKGAINLINPLCIVI